MHLASATDKNSNHYFFNATIAHGYKQPGLDRGFRAGGPLHSFSGAAAELQVSTGTVSRQIARLEKKMGVQLLERSTRKVALTEIGKTFYESGSQILLLAEESIAQVQDLQLEPRGTLRLTAPMLFSIKHLGPLISSSPSAIPMSRCSSRPRTSWKAWPRATSTSPCGSPITWMTG